MGFDFGLNKDKLKQKYAFLSDKYDLKQRASMLDDTISSLLSAPRNQKWVDTVLDLYKTVTDPANAALYNLSQKKKELDTINRDAHDFLDAQERAFLKQYEDEIAFYSAATRDEKWVSSVRDLDSRVKGLGARGKGIKNLALLATLLKEAKEVEQDIASAKERAFLKPYEDEISFLSDAGRDEKWVSSVRDLDSRVKGLGARGKGIKNLALLMTLLKDAKKLEQELANEKDADEAALLEGRIKQVMKAPVGKSKIDGIDEVYRTLAKTSKKVCLLIPSYDAFFRLYSDVKLIGQSLSDADEARRILKGHYTDILDEYEDFERLYERQIEYPHSEAAGDDLSYFNEAMGDELDAFHSRYAKITPKAKRLLAKRRKKEKREANKTRRLCGYAYASSLILLACVVIGFAVFTISQVLGYVAFALSLLGCILCFVWIGAAMKFDDDEIDGEVPPMSTLIWLLASVGNLALVITTPCYLSFVWGWQTGTEINNGVLVRLRDCDDNYYVVPDEITEIGTDAFKECPNLSSITLHSGLTIDSWAFSGTSVTSLSVPSDCTLRERAFAGTNLQTLTLTSSSITIDAGAFRETSAEVNTDSWPTSTTILDLEPLAYQGYEGASITITDSSLLIHDYMFQDATAAIGYPSDYDSLTDIGCVFAGYKGTDLLLPASLTSLKVGALRDCSNITKLIVPDTVEQMDKECLFGCSSLQKLAIPFVGYNENHSKTMSVLGDQFKNVTDIYVTGHSDLETDAFAWMPNLKRIYIEDAGTIYGSFVHGFINGSEWNTDLEAIYLRSADLLKSGCFEVKNDNDNGGTYDSFDINYCYSESSWDSITKEGYNHWLYGWIDWSADHPVYYNQPMPTVESVMA